MTGFTGSSSWRLVPSPKSSWHTHWLALGLALLIHLAIFPLPLLHWKPSATPPVEITSIDQAEVEKLRKTLPNYPRDIVVSNQAAAETSPEDARYASNRNLRVKREQRARSGGVLPQKGRQQRRAIWAPLGAGELPSREREATENSETARDAMEQAIGEDLPEGNETLLNARESVYYSFFFRIRESVGLLWQSLVREAADSLALREGTYQTTIEAVLDTSGNLLELKTLESSSYALLDLAVEEAWRRVNHFPHPPQGLVEADGRIHLRWTFTLELGNDGMLFLPPRRHPGLLDR